MERYKVDDCATGVARAVVAAFKAEQGGVYLPAGSVLRPEKQRCSTYVIIVTAVVKVM